VYRLRNYWFVFGATMLFLWWLPRMVEWVIEGLDILWQRSSR